MMRTAAELRAEAQALEAQLNRMERFDWPRWLREADGITRRVSELRRQATQCEQDGARRSSAYGAPEHRV
jgi:hypothetical protein